MTETQGNPGFHPLLLRPLGGRDSHVDLAPGSSQKVGGHLTGSVTNPDFTIAARWSGESRSNSAAVQILSSAMEPEYPGAPGAAPGTRYARTRDDAAGPDGQKFSQEGERLPP